MKIWLDTTDLNVIKKAKKLGLLFGVTTNPAIIAASRQSLESVLKGLLENQDGPVAAQVLAHNTAEMIHQAEILHRYSKRIIVKIPVSETGLEAIRHLSQNGIPIMATTIFQPHQALLSAHAGATFVAPYIGQMEKAGQDPWNVLQTITKIYNNYSIKTEILAASIPTLEHFLKCAEMSIPHITIKEPVFQLLINTVPATQEWMNKFSETWEQSNTPFLPKR